MKEMLRQGKKPKAVIVVHLYGMPAKIKEISEICSMYEITLIEDAAESLGSTYQGQKTGTLGDFGILSFNGNKIITTSGGGMLVTKDKRMAEQARYLATQAREPFPYYEHVVIGFNYRMSNVLAGIGRGQLRVIDERVEKRRKNFELYKMFLNEIEEIDFPEEPDGHFSNRWLTTILIQPNKKQVTPEMIRLKLEERNIESRPLWKPMHLQPVFKDYQIFETGVSENLFNHGLCLPSGSNLMEEEIEMISKLIHNLF
jgi:dTDP-4-amino-4,6-dideoxygalactose transaminase